MPMLPVDVPASAQVVIVADNLDIMRHDQSQTPRLD